jgi:hypothetical protein
MITPEKIELLVKKSLDGESGEFRACAFFDDSLDCIRVVARDCSVTEIRVNPIITVLEANYPKGRKCVGFTIKGARHLCQTYGLNPSAPIKISLLLDAILSACPDVMAEAFVDHVARPLIRDEGIEQVELGQVSELTPQPA